MQFTVEHLNAMLRLRTEPDDLLNEVSLTSPSFSQSDHELQTMGDNSSQLVKIKFDWHY